MAAFMSPRCCAAIPVRRKLSASADGACPGACPAAAWMLIARNRRQTERMSTRIEHLHHCRNTAAPAAAVPKGAAFREVERVEFENIHSEPNLLRALDSAIGENS